MSARILLRLGDRLDWPLVLDSFTREYGKTPQGKPMGEKLLRRALTALLKSSRWMLTVAAPVEQSSEIYGWMLWSMHDVAWIHVKEFWRGQGFAKALLGERCGNIGTPFVPDVSLIELANEKGIQVRARPHLLLREVLNGP